MSNSKRVEEFRGKKIILDDYEKETLEELNQNKHLIRKPTEQERKEFQQAAKNTIERKKSLTIRLSGRDMSKLKKAAAEKGIPLGTMVSSFIHQNIGKATSQTY